MKDYNDNDIRRSTIMEHYSNPKYKNNIEKPDLSSFSNHCVDELHISWTFDKEVLKEAKWDGKGCAVFQSSSDIFIERILGKTKTEIIEVANQYENLINQRGDYNESLLGDLMVFKNVKKQLNRLDCANMISQAVIKNENAL